MGYTDTPHNYRVYFPNSGKAVDVGIVEGTAIITVGGAVVTVGVTSGGWEVNSLCLSCSAFSNTCSVSLNLSFNLMTSVEILNNKHIFNGDYPDHVLLWNTYTIHNLL